MSKLVNEQTGEELSIPAGESFIGRGPLLKVADKRVSRNHALLAYEGEVLRLCPKHSNPCFYKAREGEKFKALPRNSWKSLQHGDQFSLLPNDLVFRIVMPLKDLGSEVPKSCTLELSEDPKKSIEIPILSDKDTTHVVAATELPTTAKTKGDLSGHGDPESRELDCAVTSTVSLPKEAELSPKVKSALASVPPTGVKRKRSLPPWLSEVKIESKPPPAKKHKAPPVAAKSKAVDKDGDRLSVPKKTESSVTSAVHTASSLSCDVSDKDPSYSAAPKHKAVKPHSPSSSSISPSPPPVLKTTADDKSTSKLPPCPYGAKCYRKNLAHFNEYSHPGTSSDEESGSTDKRPVCPYGTACYRTNPGHHSEYRHDGPYVAKPRGKAGRRSARSTKGKRSVLDGESDEDDMPNTYDYKDSFIDDDDAESSSYGGSDSEDLDWAPAEDSENVGELLAEAKSFTDNKKMRKPI